MHPFYPRGAGRISHRPCIVFALLLLWIVVGCASGIRPNPSGDLSQADPESLPIFGTIASQYNDPGVNRLYRGIMGVIREKTGAPFEPAPERGEELPEKIDIIPWSKDAAAFVVRFSRDRRSRKAQHRRRCSPPQQQRAQTRVIATALTCHTFLPSALNLDR